MINLGSGTDYGVEMINAFERTTRPRRSIQPSATSLGMYPRCMQIAKAESVLN